MIWLRLLASQATRLQNGSISCSVWVPTYTRALVATQIVLTDCYHELHLGIYRENVQSKWDRNMDEMLLKDLIVIKFPIRSGRRLKWFPVQLFPLFTHCALHQPALPNTWISYIFVLHPFPLHSQYFPESQCKILSYHLENEKPMNNHQY